MGQVETYKVIFIMKRSSQDEIQYLLFCFILFFF